MLDIFVNIAFFDYIFNRNWIAEVPYNGYMKSQFVVQCSGYHLGWRSWNAGGCCSYVYPSTDEDSKTCKILITFRGFFFFDKSLDFNKNICKLAAMFRVHSKLILSILAGHLFRRAALYCIQLCTWCTLY